MRKFLLALAASTALTASAFAAPYKVQDANGIPLGPVIGLGQMIVVAPDGTPVAVFMDRNGFVENGTGDVRNQMIVSYLTPDCSGPAYLGAGALPVQGFFFSSNGIASGVGHIDYAAPPYQVVNQAYYVNNGICTEIVGDASLGVGTIFNISHPTPFSVVPWTAPDID